VACVGHIPRTFYVEAKAAKTIEKSAWEQYWKLVAAGNMLIIVFEKIRWGWNFLEEIELIPAEKTIASFPPERRFPVVDGWITPRISDRWNRIRQQNPQASGTPYRFIDEASLRLWPDFKQAVIQRLQSRLEAVA
jgi:hypothetical protein